MVHLNIVLRHTERLAEERGHRLKSCHKLCAELNVTALQPLPETVTYSLNISTANDTS